MSAPAASARRALQDLRDGTAAGCRRTRRRSGPIGAACAADIGSRWAMIVARCQSTSSAAATGRSSTRSRRGCPCSCSAGSAPRRRRAQTWSAASAMNTPPAPALPCIAAMTRRSVASISVCVRSSIALMLRHDSSAGLSAASITFRWMPFDQKSAPPNSTSTRAGCASAKRSAARQALALRRAHRAVVEGEVQGADVAFGLVADLPPARCAGGRVDGDRRARAGLRLRPGTPAPWAA